MFLDIYDFKDYIDDISPYLKHGVLIDTSVLIPFFDGLIFEYNQHKDDDEKQKIHYVLKWLKLQKNWQPFLVTPHILSEFFKHVKDCYSGYANFNDIVTLIFKDIKKMSDVQVNKDDILNKVELGRSVMEVGDLSIFCVADSYFVKKEKISILTKDRDFQERYQDIKEILVINYAELYPNLLYKQL